MRAMLDSHPALAIPPETHIVPMLLRRGTDRGGGWTPGRFVRAATSSGFLAKWGLDRVELEALVGSPSVTSAADAVRAMYQWYARTQSKPYAGDKTPNYVGELGLLAKAFPTARFVHLVRDPRDVAASFRRVGFEPHPGVTALRWRRIVDRWDAASNSLAPRLLEVRYEDLVCDPERVVREVCAFIDLEFDAAMLTYAQRADDVLAGVDDPSLHERVREPPRWAPRWPQELSPVEVAGIERLVGDRLVARGYGPVATGAGARIYGWVLGARGWHFVRQGRARLVRRWRGVVARP